MAIRTFNRQEKQTVCGKWHSICFTPVHPAKQNTTYDNTTRDDKQAPSLDNIFPTPVSERTTAMTKLIHTLIADEAGFIVSAELVLISTIAVLGMVVGLSEVAVNLNNELEDVGSAFGALNQSYCVNGASGHQGSAQGSCFQDSQDFCDNPNDIQCVGATGESGGNGNGNGFGSSFN
jgi:hypothetical protein